MQRYHLRENQNALSSKKICKGNVHSPCDAGYLRKPEGIQRSFLHLDAEKIFQPALLPREVIPRNYSYFFKPFMCAPAVPAPTKASDGKEARRHRPVANGLFVSLFAQ